MLIDTLFNPVGKNTYVDLGFHFTSEDSMGHIQRDGLMTMSDRESNPKLNSQEARHKHGGVFGDGVYTGKIWYFSYTSHLYLLLMYLSLFQVTILLRSRSTGKLVFWLHVYKAKRIV